MRAVAVGDRLPASGGSVRPGAAAGLAVGVLGAISLALRPVGWEGIVATVAIGLIAVLAAPAQAPGPSPGVRDGRPSPVPVLAVGLLAVLAARAAGAPIPGPASAVGIGASLAAAVAEEALFRGVLHGALHRLGAGAFVAIGVPAALFALVHLPGYGTGALPVNLAAGLLLGWQRQVSGSWAVPAATHGTANLILYL